MNEKVNIHDNPDADAWAKEFKSFYPDGDFVPDLDIMRGWFANAMMAMHDYVKREYDGKYKCEAYDDGHRCSNDAEVHLCMNHFDQANKVVKMP